VSWLGAAAVVLAAGLAYPPPPESPLVPKKVGKRFDAPDLAEAWYRQRREATPGGPTPERAYRLAHRRRATMDRYSTRRGARSEGGRFERAAAAAPGAASELDAWEPLGPGNIGGRTRALVIHPERTKILYAAGVSGGIWRSRNGGRRWEPIGDEMANLAVNALAIDPAEPETLYAGTGEGFFRETVRATGLPLRGGGIFKSTDGGDAWEQLRATRGPRFHWVNDLVVSPLDARRLYAATRQGVFRSLDGGGKWRRVLNPRANGGCLDLELRPDGAGDFLFAACGTLGPAAVWRNAAAERNGGWEVVLKEPGMGRTSLAVAPSEPSVVYALSASNTPGPGGNFEQGLLAVFRSVADGEAGSWEARVRNDDSRVANRTLLTNPVYALLAECGFEGPSQWFSMGWYVNVIRVDPADADTVWLGGVDVFRSLDGGLNWNPASWWWGSAGSPGFVHADQHNLVFDPKRSNILYSLNDGGVFVTRNARAYTPTDDLAICFPDRPNPLRWQSLNNGYGVTQFYHGAPFPGDPGRYLGGTQDNGTVMGSDAGGENGWRMILGGDGAYVAVDPRDDDVVYASFQNGALRKSSDGGASFRNVVAGIPDLQNNPSDGYEGYGPNFLFVSPFVLDPSDAERLWLGGRRLWRTADGAASWQAASAELRAGGKASAIAVAPDDSDRVLVGTSAGFVHRSSSATTTDSTTAWEEVRPRAGFVTWVAFDPSDSAIAYATYGGFGGAHVWKSVDGGASWSAIDGRGRGALPDVPVHSIVVDPEDGERLYVGTDVGVFVSTDGGGSWMVENTGFAAAVTETLALTDGPRGERWLFAFTHGRGAWRLKL
jgi:photosystem II stability/assembly factor-like uncharacterized protein